MPALESSYTRVRELGRGGMGVVTLARQHSLDRLVAIKELLVGGNYDAELIHRFAREAQVLAKLAHPNVVKLLDFDLSHEPPYIVCEYIEDAVPLAQLLVEQPPSRDHALRLAQEMAEALAHVHAAGLMHRDLKPGNVLVDAGAHARLIDFGLARAVTPEESKLTQTGYLIGTYTYMAPEQMAGKAADARADVYAFGLLLYELLAGGLVFAAGAPQQVTPGVRWLGKIPPLAERAPGVDARLAALIERCLRVEAGERYADGAALVQALAAARGPAPRASRPVSAARPRRTDPPRTEEVGESRLALGVALAVAMLGGVAIGLGVFGGAPAPVSLEPVASASAAEDDLLDLARAAATLEPRAVVEHGRKRPITSVELGVMRTEAAQRFTRLLQRAAAVLDAPDASMEAKRAVYEGVARLRLLDRMLELNGLPRLSTDQALGRTFAVGAPPGVDLAHHELGLAQAQVKFRQIGVELPGLMKDIIEVSTDGQERVTVDLATPASELKWAALHLRVARLGRRDLLWVTVNDLALMVDDRCVAQEDRDGWVLCHCLDPRLLRTTGNVVQVAHEPLPGEGSASILRMSERVGITGGIKPLVP